MTVQPRSRSDSCCFVLILCYFVDRMLFVSQGNVPTKLHETHAKSHKTDHHFSRLVIAQPLDRE